jgi:hypothetical protein
MISWKIAPNMQADDIHANSNDGNKRTLSSEGKHGYAIL